MAATAVVHELAKRRSLVVSLQVLNEMTNILLNKRRDLSLDAVREIVEPLAVFGDAPLSWEIIDVAWRVRELTGYGWWDSLLVATAHLEKCRYFLSEDMQHERAIFDVTIVNPFVTSPFDLPLPN
ncbi:PIN domain-containing protein [Methylopila sp. 73B]|uniref:PIN domain-containing protein n=1 Tax=Methylopila sp. 73B TaxID=1120792 RepID=UPI00037312C4|nr:PIN domain-containing protein [Methylopila sp. 73B]